MRILSWAWNDGPAFYSCKHLVYMCFADFEKVYDWEILWEVLREYRMWGSLLRAIQSLYAQSESCKSDLFPVGVGIRQSCALAPILFVIFMDRISRCTHGGEGLQFGGLRIVLLLFAEDVVQMGR